MMMESCGQLDFYSHKVSAVAQAQAEVVCDAFKHQTPSSLQLSHPSDKQKRLLSHCFVIFISLESLFIIVRNIPLFVRDGFFISVRHSSLFKLGHIHQRDLRLQFEKLKWKVAVGCKCSQQSDCCSNKQASQLIGIDYWMSEKMQSQLLAKIHWPVIVAESLCAHFFLCWRFLYQDHSKWRAEAENLDVVFF